MTITQPKERISDQIKSRLKQAILDGEFTPGDKLPPEAELAQTYQVSKVSAREALRELESQGLIEKRRGIFGGSFVAEPGSEKMVDVVINAFLFGGIQASDMAEFRRILEPGLARLAAQRRTPEDLAAMAQCIEDVAASVEAGKPDQTRAIEFHRLMADACHNPFISHLMEALVKAFQMVFTKSPVITDARRDLEYNRAFYRCLKERDGETAARLMADHFDTLDSMVSAASRLTSNNNPSQTKDEK
ncbi:MAG: FadR family transcriptional regulator [Desulfobacterales bacterium]|nr:FadR family transcriptional regulator [Desulfobacterales bacterium]